TTPTRQSLAAAGSEYCVAVERRGDCPKVLTVRAARSVYSGSKSRVIESRKDLIAGASGVSVSGGSSVQNAVRPSRKARQAMFCTKQPGAESRANACVDSLATREIPVSPFAKSGMGLTPATKVLGQELLRGFCQRISEEANGIEARAMS